MIIVEKGVKIRGNSEEFTKAVERVVNGMKGIQTEVQKTNEISKKILDLQTFDIVKNTLGQVLSQVKSLTAAVAEYAQGARDADIIHKKFENAWGSVGEGMADALQQLSRYTIETEDAERIASRLKTIGFERVQAETLVAATAKLSAEEGMKFADGMEMVLRAMTSGQTRGLVALGLRKEENLAIQTAGDLYDALVNKAGDLTQQATDTLDEINRTKRAWEDVEEALGRALLNSKVFQEDFKKTAETVEKLARTMEMIVKSMELMVYLTKVATGFSGISGLGSDATKDEYMANRETTSQSTPRLGATSAGLTKSLVRPGASWAGMDPDMLAHAIDTANTRGGGSRGFKLDLGDISYQGMEQISELLDSYNASISMGYKVEGERLGEQLRGTLDQVAKTLDSQQWLQLAEASEAIKLINAELAQTGQVLPQDAYKIASDGILKYGKSVAQVTKELQGMAYQQLNIKQSAKDVSVELGVAFGGNIKTALDSMASGSANAAGAMAQLGAATIKSVGDASYAIGLQQMGKGIAALADYTISWGVNAAALEASGGYFASAGILMGIGGGISMAGSAAGAAAARAGAGGGAGGATASTGVSAYMYTPMGKPQEQGPIVFNVYAKNVLTSDADLGVAVYKGWKAAEKKGYIPA